jgi:hypothetical protein
VTNAALPASFLFIVLLLSSNWWTRSEFLSYFMAFTTSSVDRTAFARNAKLMSAAV